MVKEIENFYACLYINSLEPEQNEEFAKYQ